MSYTWLGTYYSMLCYAAEMYDASSHLAYIKENLTALGLPATTPPPKTSFFPLLSLVSSQTTSLLPPEEPTPFFFPNPCLKAWLTSIHAALCIAVNSKNIFILWLSLHMQNSRCIWISPISMPPTGLIKVNHLWQTAILHQMEQVIHCQSNRTRILQLQLLSIRNSLQEKKRI